MQIDSLKYFTQVADLKSISKVASTCHISQPALSQQLAKLESELGVNLFSRSNRGVEITEKGEIVYSYAKRILDSYSALVDEIGTLETHKKVINITVGGISGNFILSNISKDIIKLFEGYEVNINNYWYNDHQVSILQNKADIVVGSTKIEDIDVISKKIGKDKLILVSKTRTDVKLDENIKIALLDEGKNKNYYSDRNVILQTDSLSTIRNFLDNDGTYAIAPYSAIIKDIEKGEIVYIKNKEYEIEFDIFISYKKNIEAETKKKILVLFKKLESILK